MAALSQPASVEIRRIKAMENRARRAAKSVGLRAVKSRNRYIPNEGGFQLVNIYSRRVEAGREFELTPEDVLYFCNRWPEESKFALGASMRWDEYHRPPQPQPAKITALPDPTVFQVPVAAAIHSCSQAEPALPETGGETKSGLKNWQEWGFPGGVKDLEITPRPGWILTFEEVYKDLGYKSARGLKASLKTKTFDYPPEALAQGLITKTGCQLLKSKKQNNRCIIKQRSAEKTRSEKENPTHRNYLGTT
jgi:hypothetical protein